LLIQQSLSLANTYALSRFLLHNHAKACKSTGKVMVVLARQIGQLKKEIKKWKKDFQKPISD
jgi:hypothetical protein